MDATLYAVSPLVGHVVCLPSFRSKSHIGRIVSVQPEETSKGLPRVTVEWANGVRMEEWAAHLLSFERITEERAATAAQDAATIARMKAA